MNPGHNEEEGKGIQNRTARWCLMIRPGRRGKNDVAPRVDKVTEKIKGGPRKVCKWVKEKSIRSEA